MYLSCLCILHLVYFVVFLEILVSTCKTSNFPSFVHGTGNCCYFCYNNIRISVYLFEALSKVMTYRLDASTCIHSLYFASYQCFYPWYHFFSAAIRYNCVLSVINYDKILSGWLNITFSYYFRCYLRTLRFWTNHM